MNFKTATDVLGLSAIEMGKAFGLQPQTIRQMRLEPMNPSYRSPPPNWPEVVARLARQRARDLEGLAAELERIGGSESGYK